MRGKRNLPRLPQKTKFKVKILPSIQEGSESRWSLLRISLVWGAPTMNLNYSSSNVLFNFLTLILAYRLYLIS